jgi:mannose-6-phosphate isomerase-like protein (cupin superfamily)
MPSIAFDTKRASRDPDIIAPDGSAVRMLCAVGRGSMALFRLPPGGIAKPVAHRTVDEIWYVIAGEGRIWRRQADQEEIVKLMPGVSITIPVGAQFQFRCDGAFPLDIVGVTMPPWPGMDEAYAVEGAWQATE